jgi:CcmD family protein
MGSLGFVMAVTLVTWLGIFSYLLYLDRSLRRLENLQRDKKEDDL